METSEPDLERSAIVLYGTETGTSQDVAEEVGRALQRLWFYVDVTGCDSATYQDLATYDLTVFVIATTGQGDFPSNARKLWTALLRKKLSSTTLAGIEYALIGLCDSSYLKFNWAARKLEKRLKQLGAREILDSCEADDQGDDGTDGSFLTWLERFRSTVLARFPLPAGKETIPETESLPSKWMLQHAGKREPASSLTANLNGVTDEKALPFSTPESFPAILELNDRVTPPSHWQDVRLLRLMTPSHLTYLPGDALAISPENMPQDVDTLVDLMGWHDIATAPVVLASEDTAARAGRLNPAPLPLARGSDQITLRCLLTRYLDINTIPRRSFFAAMAKYTTNEMHKERLLEFTEPQYLDEYYDYATRPRRSILEVLQEFDSVKIPWQQAISVFPVLRPRQFSIASGGALKGSSNGTVFELLVAIVKYRTVIKRIREGVCTRYLAQLPVGTRLNVSLRTDGRFSSRAEVAPRNHLLIGAGTGIAPLRALLHEKALWAPTNTASILVFGSRNAAADFFFSHEWEALSNPSSERSLKLEVFPAFSRDQKAKIYVQDRIREQGRHLVPLLMDPNTVVIVCGASGQMPKAVRQALVDILSLSSTQAVNGEQHLVNGVSLMSPDEAEQFISRLEKEGRYMQETWS